MAAKFELKHTTNGKPMFTLKAPNGQVILTSQMYSSIAAAKNGIESVKENAPNHDRFEMRTTTNGAPYFVLTAANGQVIGRSEVYSSTSAARNGIASVQRNAPGARMDDLT